MSCGITLCHVVHGVFTCEETVRISLVLEPEKCCDVHLTMTM